MKKFELVYTTTKTHKEQRNEVIPVKNKLKGFIEYKKILSPVQKISPFKKNT